MKIYREREEKDFFPKHMIQKLVFFLFSFVSFVRATTTTFQGEDAICALRSEVNMDSDISSSRVKYYCDHSNYFTPKGCAMFCAIEMKCGSKDDDAFKKYCRERDVGSLEITPEGSLEILGAIERDLLRQTAIVNVEQPIGGSYIVNKEQEMRDTMAHVKTAYVDFLSAMVPHAAFDHFCTLPPVWVEKMNTHHQKMMVRMSDLLLDVARKYEDSINTLHIMCQFINNFEDHSRFSVKNCNMDTISKYIHSEISVDDDVLFDLDDCTTEEDDQDDDNMSDAIHDLFHKYHDYIHNQMENENNSGGWLSALLIAFLCFIMLAMLLTCKKQARNIPPPQAAVVDSRNIHLGIEVRNLTGTGRPEDSSNSEKAE